MAWVEPLLGGSPAAPGTGVVLWGTAPLLVSLLMRIVTKDWSDLGLKLEIFRRACIDLHKFHRFMIFSLKPIHDGLHIRSWLSTICVKEGKCQFTIGWLDELFFRCRGTSNQQPNHAKKDIKNNNFFSHSFP